MKDLGTDVDACGRPFRRLQDADGTIWRSYTPEDWFGWERPPTALPAQMASKPHSLEGDKTQAARAGFTHSGYRRR